MLYNWLPSKWLLIFEMSKSFLTWASAFFIRVELFLCIKPPRVAFSLKLQLLSEYVHILYYWMDCYSCGFRDAIFSLWLVDCRGFYLVEGNPCQHFIYLFFGGDIKCVGFGKATSILLTVKKLSWRLTLAASLWLTLCGALDLRCSLPAPCELNNPRMYKMWLVNIPLLCTAPKDLLGF